MNYMIVMMHLIFLLIELNFYKNKKKLILLTKNIFIIMILVKKYLQ